MTRLLLTFRAALDFLVLSVAFWAAYLFRFEFHIPSSVLPGVLRYWPIVVAVQYLGLLSFRVTRLSWRYLNMRDTV